MMKKVSLMTLLAGLLLFLITPAMAATDTKTATVLPIAQVLENLKTEGYSVVWKIKLEKDVYEAKVMSPQGSGMKLTINAKTGKIIKPKSKPTGLTMLDAVKKVEAAGYRDISKIETEDDEYEMRAINKDGKNVKLNVDLKTGKVSEPWFD